MSKIMTTEQALRAALSSILEDYEGSEDMLEMHTLDKLDRARAALALPAPEVTLEYRVKYEAEDYCGQWEEKIRNCHESNVVRFAADTRKEYPYRCRNSRIQSREVRTGPWLPVVQP